MPHLDTATTGTTARQPARNKGQRLTACCNHHAAACKLLQHSGELDELQGWANGQIYSGTVQIRVTRGGDC